MYIVLCTCPDLKTAQKIGKALIEEKIAACTNLIEVKESIYQWKGKIVQEPEVLMVIKMPKKNFEKVKEKIKKLHPYSVPEIVALSPEDVSTEYFTWVEKTSS